MRSTPTWYRVIATASLTGAVVLTGCTPNRQDTNTTAAADSAAMRNQQAGRLDFDSGGMNGINANTQLDDGQIAHVAMTVNRLDSANASAVVDRLTNADAKAFARRMMTEHGATMDSLRAVTSRLGSASSGNQLSTSLEQMASRPLAGAGATLDREYMDAEVVMHQQVLRTLDETLLPQVRDASLKASLTRMRTAVAGHLQNAEAIRSQLVASN